MKNFKLLKQVDFSGGMNSETPDATSDAAQLRKIVNMFPSEDGKALLLRPSFDTYPNVPSGSIPDGATVIAMFPFKGWVSDVEAPTTGDTVYQSDDIMVVYVAGSDTIITRLIPATGYYPIDSDLITNDMIWTSTGETPEEPDGEEVTPPPAYAAYSMTFDNDNIYFTTTDYDLAATYGEHFMDDRWVSENATYHATTNPYPASRMGEHDSEWTDEASSYNYTDITSTWKDESTLQWAFDQWYSETLIGAPTIQIRNEVESTGKISMLFPWQLNEVVLSSGITDLQPRKQVLEMKVQFPAYANVKCYILFEKASTLDNAMRYVVSYRSASSTVPNPNPWIIATNKNTLTNAMICYTQSVAETVVANRYTEVTIGPTTYIKVPFTTPSAAMTEIKIEALPSTTVPSEMNYEGSAAILGVEL